MHLPDFVVHPGVIKDTLGGGGFAGINMSGNSKIALVT
jgi:hypothetical protein